MPAAALHLCARLPVSAALHLGVDPCAQTVYVELSGTTAPATGLISAHYTPPPAVSCTLSGITTPASGLISARYDPRVWRGTWAQLVSPLSRGIERCASKRAVWRGPQLAWSGTAVPLASARATPACARASWASYARLRSPVEIGMDRGLPLARDTSSAWLRLFGLPERATLAFGTGRPLADTRASPWIILLRDARPGIDAMLRRGTPTADHWANPHGAGTPLRRAWSASLPFGSERCGWGGPIIIVVPPPPEVAPCYVPDGALHLRDLWTGSGALHLLCSRAAPGATVVVPIRRVYWVLNSASLTRLSDGADIPCVSLTLSLDVASWAWGLQATLAGRAAWSLIQRARSD